jgi:FkbM family methyltransferase
MQGLPLLLKRIRNMGSSAVSIVGEHRGTISQVSSFTLNTIAKKYNLQKIDFIKCDIEGAESVVFKDSELFNKYRPRIVIELHMIGASNTLQAC